MNGIVGSRKRRMLGTILYLSMLVLASILFLLPFVWMIKTAFMEAPQIVAYPPEWIPRPITLRAFREGIARGNFPLFMKNTVVITALCILGTTISSSMAGFAFARLRGPGKSILFTLLLSTMMIPSTVTLIPMFVLYSNLHWVDTILPLVLPSFLGGGAFNIFLLRQFFGSIPKELAESAMIDGCTWPRIFSSIYIPNAKPALLVVVMFTFVACWNDYFGPMIYLVNPSKFTIAIGLATFKTQYGTTQDLGPMMAMALLTVLPVLLLYLFCQKYFVQGVVTSGVKG